MSSWNCMLSGSEIATNIGTNGCTIMQNWWKILTPFQTKKCHFTDPFSVLAFRQKLRHHYLDSVRKQKNYSNAFGIRILLLLSYSFGIETINTFKRSRNTLENHTRFQTKMGKVYIRFQTKTVQKPDPMGRHMPIYIRENPSPGYLTFYSIFIFGFTCE